MAVAYDPSNMNTQVAFGQNISGSSSLPPVPVIADAQQPASITDPSAGMAMGMAAASGLIAGIGAAYAQQAQGYYQQAGYAVQAQENLRLAGLRADKAVEYGEAAFKRNLMKIEYETLNYKIQANNQLKNLRATNAAILARGYASGVVATGGSYQGIRGANVREVYQDVGISDLNAMTARILGLEDATTMLQQSYDMAFYEREAAIVNAGSLKKAGTIAKGTGGLLAGVQLSQAGANFAMNYPQQPKTTNSTVPVENRSRRET
jgi:hypothetical protein